MSGNSSISPLSVLLYLMHILQHSEGNWKGKGKAKDVGNGNRTSCTSNNYKMLNNMCIIQPFTINAPLMPGMPQWGQWTWEMAMAPIDFHRNPNMFMAFIGWVDQMKA